MVNVQIPERLQEGFVIYLNLSASKRKKLIESIENIPFGLVNSGVSKYIQTNIDIDSKKSYQITEVINSFLNLEKEIPSFEITELATSFIKELKNKKFKVPKNSIKFISELLLVSQNENLKISKKAVALEYERPNLITDSKIITDIRPIFGLEQNNDAEIKNSIILYNLRLSFVKDTASNISEKLFFALDENDLKELKNQIIRAEEKAKQLNKTYNIISIEKNNE